MRVGQGFDAHRLVAGRKLVLAGVEIASERGLAGHSDGDVVLHAVASALLGALGAGDLGQHFPSSDPSLRGIASSAILAKVVAMALAAGYAVGNVDATIVAQAPRLGPQREEMAHRLAALLGVEAGRVNLKITSTDGLGFIGREEGIAALAVLTLERAGAGG